MERLTDNLFNMEEALHFWLLLSSAHCEGDGSCCMLCPVCQIWRGSSSLPLSPLSVSLALSLSLSLRLSLSHSSASPLSRCVNPLLWCSTEAPSSPSEPLVGRIWVTAPVWGESFIFSVSLLITDKFLPPPSWWSLHFYIHVVKTLTYRIAGITLARLEDLKCVWFNGDIIIHTLIFCPLRCHYILCGHSMFVCCVKCRVCNEFTGFWELHDWPCCSCRFFMCVIFGWYFPLFVGGIWLTIIICHHQPPIVSYHHIQFTWCVKLFGHSLVFNGLKAVQHVLSKQTTDRNKRLGQQLMFVEK